jgi:hypothetical protein
MDAPPAPVALVGHITIDELKDARQGLRPVEILNGFGNRVLWTYCDRRQVLPNAEAVPKATLNPLVRRLTDALQAARGARVVKRTPAAANLWTELYEEIAKDDASGAIDALTARGEAQVLRLSLTYALLDGSHAIDTPHLESAWEVWRYCRWSAQHIWVGDGTGDPDLDRIAAVLEGGEQLTGRQLDAMFTGRSVPRLRARAIALGVAEEIRNEPTGKPGRPSIVLAAPMSRGRDKFDKPAWWASVWFTRKGGVSV